LFSSVRDKAQNLRCPKLGPNERTEWGCGGKSYASRIAPSESPARSGFFGKAAMLANGAGADLHTN
jgi:hypothetical protein